MQNRLQRQIVHFDLSMRTNPPAMQFDMPELAKFLIERVNAGLSVKLIEAERYLISITHARILAKPNGGPALGLLFAFADPDAADPANMHLQTRAVRFFPMLDGEGRAVSAHAVMDLEPRRAGTSIFRVLLESADRLGKTRVKTMLGSELRTIFHDEELVVENADGKEVPAKPVVDLDAVASDTLRQSIRQGSLKEVTLIDASALDRGFDAPAPVKVRRREMSLKVDVPVGQTIENVLNQIRPWAREQGFDEMYVRWTRPRTGGDDENVTASEPERAKINLAQEDIGETLFAKKEFISLKVPLADLCVEPSEEMLNGMLAILQ